MPSKKSTIKKTTRKPAAKRTIKRAAKKRAPRKTTSRAKKSMLVEEQPLPIETARPFVLEDVLPQEPEPTIEPQEKPADEVAPFVPEPHLTTLSSRISFYLGVVTGAAVMHVLVFALVAIMNS